ncbi:hypothetical protein [Streptomyces sp. E-08]|uniref:hypothetical protein n=1 Tax=Streptomyces sp. E-08 TaxID=3404047 RepID=UPI003CF8195F
MVWALALLAGGIWALTAGDGDADDTDPAGKAPAKPSLAPRPAVAWTVPPAGRAGDESVGFWGLGSAVAQGRTDGLFAYDAADGRVRWSVPAPTREALCAMTPDTEEGVGLIAYGRHDKPCATKKAAISIYPELVPVPGGHVVLNQILMHAEPAAYALR